MQFIETTELLHVQGPKNNIKVLGDYPRADGPLGGKEVVLTQIQNL
jgi:hypothetical protein